jgi:hypothetical protein
MAIDTTKGTNKKWSIGIAFGVLFLGLSTLGGLVENLDGKEEMVV